MQVVKESNLDLKPITRIKEIFAYCYFCNNNFEKKDKTLILSHGSIGSIALPFLDNKFKVDFYTLACINESKNILDLCRKYKRIVTLEEHSEINGFFAFISSMLAKNKILIDIDYVAIKEDHISTVGDQDYLREKTKLNSDSLYPKII